MKILILCFFLSPVLLFAQPELRIRGKVKGLPDGQQLALVDLNKPTDTLAKATVKNGSFKIKQRLKEPLLCRLAYNREKSSVLFLGNSAVRIKGSIDKVEKIKVRGSATNSDFMTFQKTFNPLFQRLMNLNREQQSGGQSDSLQMAFERSSDSIRNAVDMFIAKHRKSAVSAFVITATVNLEEDILKTEARLNKLSPSATDNVYGNYIKQMVAENKATAIGAVAADFTQPDTSGTPVSLSSFRGKYVLIDFWASWCNPCRMENPNVVATYNKFKNKNFTVLGVSLDRAGQKARWLQAIHDDGLAWTHVSDLQYWQNAAAQQYRVESIPQNFLIGPDGKIVAKNLRGPALEEKLCEILGCN